MGIGVWNISIEAFHLDVEANKHMVSIDGLISACATEHSQQSLRNLKELKCLCSQQIIMKRNWSLFRGK